MQWLIKLGFKVGSFLFCEFFGKVLCRLKVLVNDLAGYRLEGRGQEQEDQAHSAQERECVLGASREGWYSWNPSFFEKLTLTWKPPVFTNEISTAFRIRVHLMSCIIRSMT